MDCCVGTNIFSLFLVCIRMENGKKVWDFVTMEKGKGFICKKKEGKSLTLSLFNGNDEKSGILTRK